MLVSNCCNAKPYYYLEGDPLDWKELNPIINSIAICGSCCDYSEFKEEEG